MNLTYRNKLNARSFNSFQSKHCQLKMNPPVQSYARTGKSHVDVGIPISSAICSFHNSQRTILHDGEGRRQVLTLSKQTSKIRSSKFHSLAYQTKYNLMCTTYFQFVMQHKRKLKLLLRPVKGQVQHQEIVRPESVHCISKMQQRYISK